MLTKLLPLFLIGFTPTPDAAKMEATLQNLSTPVTETRVLALRQLATLPAQKDAMEPLLAALRDPSPAVRLEAVKTWGKVGNAYDSLENRLLRRQVRNMEHETGLTYRGNHYDDWLARVFDGFKVNALDQDRNIRRVALHELAIISMNGPEDRSNCTSKWKNIATEARSLPVRSE